MHASRPRALFLLLMPANSATNRGRVDESFRHFIPPLLLRSRPHLFFTAVDTAKSSVNVVSPRNEIRNAVAVIRGEQFRVHRDQSCGIGSSTRISSCPVFDCRALRFRRISWRRCLPLFIEISISRAVLIPLCNSGNRHLRYGYRRRADTSNQSCRDRF
jgi:hypothetical protein